MPLPFLALIPWGQLVGLGGTLISGWQQAQQRKHDLAVRKMELELLVAQANVNQAALAGELAKLREAGAAKAWELSYADSMATKGGPLTNAFRNLMRPGLTTWFTLATYGLIFCILRGIGTEYLDHPLAQSLYFSTASLMEMCVTWWFGDRRLDKSTTSWGNRTAGASVTGGGLK